MQFESRLSGQSSYLSELLITGYFSDYAID